MHLYCPVVVGVFDFHHSCAVSGGDPGPGAGVAGAGDKDELGGGSTGSDAVDASLHHGEGLLGGDAIWLVVDVENDFAIVLKLGG